jgi:hypothetical protein
MGLREKSLEGCQYTLDNGDPCGQTLIGTAWLYCYDHRVVGPKQAKANRNCATNAKFRHKQAKRYSLNLFRSRHGLTEPKLRPLLDHSEPLHEEYACQDDFHQAASAKIKRIKRKIIHEPADLPSAAAEARPEVGHLLVSLKEHPWDPRHASTRNRLILAAMELQRDIGWWHADKALPKISTQATAVQELMREKNVLPGYIHALLVRVEIFRIKYFATTEKRILDQARTWLAGAEYVCDRALNRPAGKRNELLSYLRFYIDAVNVRLAFDAGEGEREQAAAHLQALNHKATAFVDAYSTGQVVATVRFLHAMGHAELQLQRRDFDGALEHLREAEAIFATMQWRSIESHHYLVNVKTALALASNNPEYPKYVQDYMTVFDRYPCFEYRHGLGALKSSYPKELANVTLPDDHAMFLDTTFTHIHPFLILK